MRRLVLIPAAVALAVLGSAGVALAHHPVVSGVAVCVDGAPKVVWTVTADAVRGYTWSVNSAASKPDNQSFTFTTGTTTFTATATWWNQQGVKVAGPESRTGGPVALRTDCVPPTTTGAPTSTSTTTSTTTTQAPPSTSTTSTSTAPATSTSAPTTSTTTVAPSSTSSVVDVSPPSSSDTSAPESSSSTAPCTEGSARADDGTCVALGTPPAPETPAPAVEAPILPETGSNPLLTALLAIALTFGGLAIVLGARRKAKP